MMSDTDTINSVRMGVLLKKATISILSSCKLAIEMGFYSTRILGRYIGKCALKTKPINK